MPTGLLLANDVTDVTAQAKRAEELGYDTLWGAELWGRDVFVTLANAANSTNSISFGTAIANVYGRSPATLAQAAATLVEISDRRVNLGIGTSTAKAVEDLHGTSFDRPVRRLHETVELIRQFVSTDGAVEYDGELFQVTDFPGLDVDVPVYAAGLGPAARRATGRTADGWLPHNIPFDRLEEAFETVRTAAREVDRDPDSISVAPYIPAAVSTDSETARAEVKGHLAYYIGSGEGYRRAVAQSFPQRADQIADAWHRGDRGEARNLVSAEMLDVLGVSGTVQEARDQFAAVADHPVIDEPIVVVPASVDQEMREMTIETLAPTTD